MSTRQQRYNPGELAPQSGTYRAVGGDNREANMDEGERLPPIPGGGEWEFVGSSGQGGGGGRGGQSQGGTRSQGQSQTQGSSRGGGQSGTQERFNPGELAPRSGVYRAVGGDNREANMDEGEHLPPIPGGGEWEFVGSSGQGGGGGRGGQSQGGGGSRSQGGGNQGGGNRG